MFWVSNKSVLRIEHSSNHQIFLKMRTKIEMLLIRWNLWVNRIFEWLAFFSSRIFKWRHCREPLEDETQVSSSPILAPLALSLSLCLSLSPDFPNFWATFYLRFFWVDKNFCSLLLTWLDHCFMIACFSLLGLTLLLPLILLPRFSGSSQCSSSHATQSIKYISDLTYPSEKKFSHEYLRSNSSEYGTDWRFLIRKSWSWLITMRGVRLISAHKKWHLKRTVRKTA